MEKTHKAMAISYADQKRINGIEVIDPLDAKEVKDNITIKAVYIKQSKNAWLLNCEYGIKWIEKSHCDYNAEKQELEAPRWLIQQKFPGEKF